MKYQLYSKKRFGRRRQYYWRLKAWNGEIIAHGEGYYNYEDCRRAIDLVRSTNHSTVLEDQTR